MTELSRHQVRPPNAKLSVGIVRAIRASDKNVQELAKLYNVTENCIRAIRNRVTWAHIPDTEDA